MRKDDRFQQDESHGNTETDAQNTEKRRALQVALGAAAGLFLLPKSARGSALGEETGVLVAMAATLKDTYKTVQESVEAWNNMVKTANQTMNLIETVHDILTTDPDKNIFLRQAKQLADYADRFVNHKGEWYKKRFPYFNLYAQILVRTGNAMVSDMEDAWSQWKALNKKFSSDEDAKKSREGRGFVRGANLQLEAQHRRLTASLLQQADEELVKQVELDKRAGAIPKGVSAGKVYSELSAMNSNKILLEILRTNIAILDGVSAGIFHMTGHPIPIGNGERIPKREDFAATVNAASQSEDFKRPGAK